MKFKIMILLLGLLLLSCKDNSQKKKITHLVQEWQGKQIKFPTDAIFTKYITDTTDFQIPTKGHKVLIYVDSLGCTGCKLKLAKWKDFIAYTDRLNKLNTFPSNATFQTFLLDTNNKVIVLGNPIHNLSVKELYIKELTRETSLW